MAEDGIVRRKEDYRFLTGHGTYTDDIDRPGQAYAIFVRSLHAHARIKRLDITAALAGPRVTGGYTSADLEADGIVGPICGLVVTSRDGEKAKTPPYPALAKDEVRFVGERVAMVIADSLA